MFGAAAFGELAIAEPNLDSVTLFVVTGAGTASFLGALLGVHQLIELTGLYQPVVRMRGTIGG